MELEKSLAWVICQLPHDWAAGTPMPQIRRRTQNVIDYIKMQQHVGLVPPEANEPLRRLMALDGHVTGPGGSSFRDEVQAAIGEVADALAQIVLGSRA